MEWSKVVITGVVFFVLFTIGASSELIVKYTWFRDYLIKRFGQKGAYRVSYIFTTIVSLPCILFLLYAVKNLTPGSFDLPRYSVIIGGLLIGAGIWVIVYSLRFLKTFRWMGHNVFGVSSEKDGLVQEGIYKYIRHPTYLGAILIFYGIFFIIPWVIILIGVVSFHIYIVLIHSKVEEKELIRRFGDAYLEYMNQTSGFVPRPWRSVGGAKSASVHRG
jgi:protein-S-isoprenylcysteine O-methyltransferase Ste14